MKISYYFIILGIVNIVFRKQLAQITAGRSVENRDIMSIVAVVAGTLLIVLGLLDILNIIHING